VVTVDQRRDHVVAELVDVGPFVRRCLPLQPVHAELDGLAATFDQSVGVEQQSRPRPHHLGGLGEDSILRHAQRRSHPVFQICAVPTAEEQGRRMSGIGEPQRPGGRIEHEVRQRHHLLHRQVEHQLVDVAHH
jgi:hypothetical protein